MDAYDASQIDNTVVDENFLEGLRNRQLADEEMDARDERFRQARVAGELDEYEREGLGGVEEEDLSSESESEDEEDEEEGYPSERSLNLDAYDCPLQEWITETRTRNEIKKRFRKFLNTYYEGIEMRKQWERQHKDEEDRGPCPYKKSREIYPGKIRNMCARNSASLEVSYGHLGEMQSLLAIWLTDVPKDMLQIFDEVLKEVVLRDFPHYAQIAKELHVRIIDLPISDRLRDLRQNDLNNLIRVSGVVTRRNGVYPQIKSYTYDCQGCGQVYGPFDSDTDRPMQCTLPQCEKTLRLNQQKCEYRNYQTLVLQETPGSVPAGRVPRYKEVELLGDLIDIARPGEEIDVIGIYTHTENSSRKDKSGFPVYGTHIKANCIQKKSSATNSGLTEEDKRRMKELSRDPNIGERIIRSIAPSIYGHRHVKTAIALSLFGGNPKQGGGGTHRVRGDINVLLLGDPGTAKSQVLKYSEKTAPRSVYTTGKGASAVGLTAGVHRDALSKEWTLEGGALVLADQGVCLIDEFDKMNEQDRTSIHEAMEQQTISVSKAGIVASLQARCAVIAAANPIGGRYDPSYTLSENVELTDPILQRFDILCVLQDVVDPVVDEQLANFVVNSHMHSHPEYVEKSDETDAELDSLDNSDSDPNNSNNRNSSSNSNGSSGEKARSNYNNEKRAAAEAAMYLDGPEPLDQETLKKYITYARAFVKPILHNIDSEKIANLYADLRRQSAISGGVPIAVRHIESVMRMAEASAKMHLRDHVRYDDVELAIKVCPQILSYTHISKSIYYIHKPNRMIPPSFPYYTLSQVMLDSFMQAQKVAVRRQLQGSFKKYLNVGEDKTLLLLHKLNDLVSRQAHINSIRADRKHNNAEIVIPTNDLENKAREVNVYDLRPFFRSAAFTTHGYTIDYANRCIIKKFPESH